MQRGKIFNRHIDKPVADTVREFELDGSPGVEDVLDVHCPALF